MAMASWMFRGRSFRPGRSIRSRHDSEDEVQLDLSKDATENAHEILSNICKKQGLTEGKRFSYLNAFVKLIAKSNVEAGELGYTMEELQCCLRVALIHEATQVRAAALRAVRYLLKEDKDVVILNKLRYPCLISRSLDLMLRNDTERIQALRLIRRMLVLAPTEFPASLARSLVSLANGAAEEKDRLLRACLATLAEIGILNPDTFISCGGVSAVMRNLLDCQLPRITESLCGVLLFLLNSPATRSQASIHLQSLAAPYCDFHWSGDRHRDEREVKFHCSRLALLSILRSWPGLLHFCHPNNTCGLKALVNILYLKQLEVRKGILDLLYELLCLPQPEWTDEFSVALEAVDPSHPRDSWKLQDGFVSAEGRDILPHLAKYRPNIIEIHLSLLLYTFLEAGLLEAIAEVVVSSDTFISVRATVLLGELLHLMHSILPSECCNLTPAIPNLLAYASDPSVPTTQHQALAAISALAQLHSMLKRRPAPASLFLDRTLQAGGWGRDENKAGRRSKLYPFVASKEIDDIIKDSAVLTHKDGFSWNWNVVRAVLKSRSESLKKLEDSNHRTFLKRLVHYFKPSSNRFSRVELGNKKQTQMYTLAGLELLDCLLEVEETEGGKLLSELLTDIWVQIDAITSSKSAHDCLFSPQHVMNSVCQDYFLFIGRLCRCSKGLRALDKAGIFQQLLHLVVSTNHDCYIKLVVSGLDYSLDGMPRVILSKVLTAPSESSRLYATQFLLVLLRARLPDFHKWGTELLVMQLYDQSKAISLAAISILSEATEEKLYLDAVISLRPSLLHLGDKGLLLLIRFLSTPNGFTFLQDANFVTAQLERWSSNYNYRYVRLVEGEIHDSLTLHQRGEDGRYSRRVTTAKHCVRDVFIPPHLYGQLVQHEKGFQLLIKEGKLENIFQVVRHGSCFTEQEILELKAALWGCGHISTSASGINLLVENKILQAVINLVQKCPVYSIRGTAFYVLGLIGTTFDGANHLSKAGWLSVRHHRHEKWPVIENEETPPSEMEAQHFENDNISVCSQQHSGWESTSGSLSQRRSSSVGESSREDSNTGHFYIPGDDDEDSLASGDDEGLHMDDGVPTRWIDLTGNIGTGTRLCTSQERRSHTLPHQRPPRGLSASVTVRQRHVRSYSESKQEHESILPATTSAHSGDWMLTLRSRKNSSRGDQESKSRSNSCTDSSGVSSCDSGLGAAVKHVGPHEQTLSPIPSSTSLNTLKSAAHTQHSRSTQIPCSRVPSSIHGSVTSEGLASPDTSSARLSHQDVLGYATLRSLHRYRRPFYSDTVSLAAMELLVFDDHRPSVSSARALKVRSLDRHYSQGLGEFEASLPPQLLGGSSSASLAARTYIGSRSNLAAVKSTGPLAEGNTTQQCYMGICLPRHLLALYPDEAVRNNLFKEPLSNRQRVDSEHQGSASLGEIDQDETAEDIDITSSSDSDEVESNVRSRPLASDYRHSASNCLSCCRIRDRKISTSSYHRYRTDTESSHGGGDSPVLVPRRRKSHSTSSCLFGLTPGGGSVDSANSNSLETSSLQQRGFEEPCTPSKAFIRREILKHVVRMGNPVWNKMSKQTLLQLKQKYPAVFQDVCLYSEVSHRLGSATYRLSARRFLQELFFDLQFDNLYEEPMLILQMQQPPGECNNNSSSLTSPQNSIPSLFPTSPSVLSGNQRGLVEHSGNNANFHTSQNERNALEMEAGPHPHSSSKLTGCEDNPSEEPESVPSKSNSSVRTAPIDIPSAVQSKVSQGSFSVRSPPLEVVKEEPVVSVSNSETSVSESDTSAQEYQTTESMRSLSRTSGSSSGFVVANQSQVGCEGTVDCQIASARNEAVIFRNPDVASGTAVILLDSDLNSSSSTDVDNPCIQGMTEGCGPEKSRYSAVTSFNNKTNCDPSANTSVNILDKGSKQFLAKQEFMKVQTAPSSNLRTAAAEKSSDIHNVPEKNNSVLHNTKLKCKQGNLSNKEREEKENLMQKSSCSTTTESLVLKNHLESITKVATDVKTGQNVMIYSTASNQQLGATQCIVTSKSSLPLMCSQNNKAAVSVCSSQTGTSTLSHASSKVENTTSTSATPVVTVQPFIITTSVQTNSPIPAALSMKTKLCSTASSSQHSPVALPQSLKQVQGPKEPKHVSVDKAVSQKKHANENTKSCTHTCSVTTVDKPLIFANTSIAIQNNLSTSCKASEQPSSSNQTKIIAVPQTHHVLQKTVTASNTRQRKLATTSPPNISNLTKNVPPSASIAVTSQVPTKTEENLTFNKRLQKSEVAVDVNPDTVKMQAKTGKK